MALEEDKAAAGSWRRGWATAGAIVATVALILLIVLVTLSNRNRDEALRWERHAYDVMLLTRTVDATIARSEAALGRYVLDERRETGTLYYTEWRRAGRQILELDRQIRDPEQQARIGELSSLYRRRGEELAPAAARAAEKRGSDALSFFYQAGLSEVGPALRAKLDQIAVAERGNLRERIVETQVFAAEAERFTEWLAWLGVLIGVGAIGLGLYAYGALAEGMRARRQADSEADRAMSLEHAVRDRTRELQDANERLLAEAAERAAAEAKLRQVQKMEAVGQLTGGIAHDFNNMLAVIVGGLDLARRKLRGPARDVEFHLDNAMEGATRAAALTRRLLAFARSEALLPKAVAPAELVENMLDLIDRAIGERINVQTSFRDDRWNVFADTNQLENAILNLCVNARDAMDGQGQLILGIDNLQLEQNEIGALAPGDYVRVRVADTGGGIPPEILDRVFEPFFTTKPVGKGTGLGLSQIFGFARQSGGDVTIDTKLGKGTIVSLYLPRSHRDAEACEDHAGGWGEQRPPTPAGTRILVVEDDPRVSRSTVGALEELGYHPFACASGAEALELLEHEGDIALVITDVMMPEMTGPELVRILRTSYPEIAILFVTGFVGEAGEADELTDAAILRKPFTVAALADAVGDALGHRFSGSPPFAASAAAE